MKIKVFAIRDSAMDAFVRPFFVPSVAMAARGFRDEVNRDGSEMFKHPKDYELFELGSFDEDIGRFENLEAPRSVCRATDVKERGDWDREVDGKRYKEVK